MLGLVGAHQAPFDFGEGLGVAAHGGVGGEDELVLVDAVKAAVGAVEAAHRSAGGEATDLGGPVRHERGRADHERRSGGGAVRLACKMMGDERDGLAQAHVVGQARAEAQFGQAGEPGQAEHLVVAQVPGELGRLAGRLGPFGFAQPVAESL